MDKNSHIGGAAVFRSEVPQAQVRKRSGDSVSAERRGLGRRPIKIKRRWSKVTIVFMLFWAIVIVASFTYFIGLAGEYNELRTNYWHVQSEIEAEETRQRELLIRQEFDDGDAFLEQLARERLGLVRPNEIVFRNIAAE